MITVFWDFLVLIKDYIISPTTSRPTRCRPGDPRRRRALPGETSRWRPRVAAARAQAGVQSQPTTTPRLQREALSGALGPEIAHVESGQTLARGPRTDRTVTASCLDGPEARAGGRRADVWASSTTGTPGPVTHAPSQCRASPRPGCATSMCGVVLLSLGVVLAGLSTDDGAWVAVGAVLADRGRGGRRTDDPTLAHLADLADHAGRGRGRRGLDLLPRRSLMLPHHGWTVSAHPECCPLPRASATFFGSPAVVASPVDNGWVFYPFILGRSYDRQNCELGCGPRAGKSGGGASAGWCAKAQSPAAARG